MTDFEEDLIRLCLARSEVVRGNFTASAQTAYVIASALATSIAAMSSNDDRVADAIARLVAADLPAMVAQRTKLFRPRPPAATPVGAVQ